MRRMREAMAFGGLALGLHVVALAALPVPPPGGAPASGGTPVGVSAPGAALRALVKSWDAPPDADGSVMTPAPPVTTPVPAPEVASLALPPGLSPAGPAATDLEPPEMPRDPVARPTAPRPKARPFVPPASVAKGAAGDAREAAAPVVPALSAGVLERGHEAGVRAALTRARRYPQRAVDRNVTGRTVLNVTIARNGRLVDARVVTGSGSDALDRASLEAAARAAFPAAPAELDGERFEYQLGLDYELN